MLHFAVHSRSPVVAWHEVLKRPINVMSADVCTTSSIHIGGSRHRRRTPVCIMQFTIHQSWRFPEGTDAYEYTHVVGRLWSGLASASHRTPDREWSKPNLHCYTWKYSSWLDLDLRCLRILNAYLIKSNGLQEKRIPRSFASIT